MGSHLIDGEFQSDKHPSCPSGEVPLSVHDAFAQDLLREYARRRRVVDAEFSDDLVAALGTAGYDARLGVGDTASEVFFYEHEFYCLSNFSAFRLAWAGVDFDTSEVAYHWEKFPHDHRVRTRLLGARSAHEAYKIAQNARGHERPDWPTVRVEVMRRILRAKADQHEYVRRKLRQTGGRRLIENSWRDPFWGWGEDGHGRNMLGGLWMEVRAELATRDGSSAP